MICVLLYALSNIKQQLLHPVRMKTRAQAQRQEAGVQKKNSAGPKKTKKQILEQKNRRNDVAAAAKGEGKKKLKEDPAPPQPPKKKKKQQAVRVTDEKASPQKTGRSKAVSKPKQQSAKKEASLQKKLDQMDRPRKKPEETAKQAENAKLKNSGKENLNGGKEEAKQQIKTIQFKGKVPIDEHCTLKHATHRILYQGGKAYSATLNQTSVTNNNNKFYIIQIVQPDANPNSCYVFTRWGRVGVRGQNSMTGPFSIDAAIREYSSRYRQKCHKGNYQQIQLNYQGDDKEDKKQEEDNAGKSGDNNNKKQFEESKLPAPTKKLIQLIFDIDMMKQQMTQIGYNVKKMPLGQLTKQHIQKGYAILQKLMDELRGRKDRRNIEHFTDQFYTNIPHDFGFSKMSNFILDSEKVVKEKIEMLEALAEIKVATSLIDAGKEAQNELDSNYKKLNRSIEPVPRNSSQFELMDKYLQSTHGSTHTSYQLQLVDLFSLKSEAEQIRYTKHIDNKMLLWHGSRLTNFVGILSQGLRIAPPEAPVTGYMFGKGVYFADMSSKSANYCYTSKENNTGILLLCEVALGDMNEKHHADYHAGNLPPGKSSTKGVGRTAPNPANAVKMEDEVVVPVGPGEPTALACTLLYNEYIVYDIAQIKIRYLLRTRFNYMGY